MQQVPVGVGAGGDTYTILEWAVVDCVGAGIGTGADTCAGACASVAAPTLIPWMHKVDQVVVELQPPVAMHTMRAMQHELHGMALGAGRAVRFQHAGQKSLAVPMGALSRAKTYSERKAAAVVDCATWLSVHAPTWSAWYAGVAKQDDIADALLHAVVALNRPSTGAPVTTVLALDVGTAHLGACVLRLQRHAT